MDHLNADYFFTALCSLTNTFKLLKESYDVLCYYCSYPILKYILYKTTWNTMKQPVLNRIFMLTHSNTQQQSKTELQNISNVNSRLFLIFFLWLELWDWWDHQPQRTSFLALTYVLMGHLWLDLTSALYANIHIIQCRSRHMDPWFFFFFFPHFG